VAQQAQAKGLTVKFHEIPAGGLDFRFSQQSGELNGALFDILGDFPVYKAELHLKPVDAMVQLKGHLSGELRHACSRCAEDFSTAFDKNFVTAFYKSEDNIKNLSGVMDGAMENLEGSFDVEFLEGNDIDLAEVVHEQVALEIPFQPLCTEHCKGLCPQCGANLNTANCKCETSASVGKTSPFEKLRSLRGD
jgi:uncharacterized protein